MIKCRGCFVHVSKQILASFLHVETKIEIFQMYFMVLLFVVSVSYRQCCLKNKSTQIQRERERDGISKFC